MTPFQQMFSPMSEANGVRSLTIYHHKDLLREYWTYGTFGTIVVL
jgi:hypothetical protein